MDVDSLPATFAMIFMLDGKVATGTATFIGFRDQEERAFAGHYRDTLRRGGKGWLFYSRLFETYLQRLLGNPNMLLDYGRSTHRNI